MSDIPDDIVKTADKLYRRYYRLTNSVTLSALVGAALLTERKRNETLIKELIGALEWMIEHDETNEGDEPVAAHGGRTWNQINAYWIEGLNNARAALAKAKKATQ